VGAKQKGHRQLAVAFVIVVIFFTEIEFDRLSQSLYIHHYES
jgi:hypothetical protein